MFLTEIIDKVLILIDENNSQLLDVVIFNKFQQNGGNTKPPILEWDKSVDLDNGTKPLFLKIGQNHQF